MLTTIKKLRKGIHQYPELSGEEKETAQRIKAFITQHHPTTIVENLGGHGLAAVYDFGKKGTTVMIRCELDALPIVEENDFAHQSKVAGVSHKCGHDGHMAMVAGLIFWIKKQTFTAGKIILLFQPAEETGQGAFQVVEDERFKNLSPDYVFALHNIPGVPLHTILTCKQNFSATVQSVAIYLKGKKCHAAEPENGINPSFAIAEMIQTLSKLNRLNPQLDDFAILTPVHLQMGQKAYGVSPAQGELHYTLRTWTIQHMQLLKDAIIELTTQQADKFGLTYSIDWFEYFPSTQNDEYCQQIIMDAAQANDFQIEERPYPFKFGEDFGWFSQRYRAAMFGLGAGVDTPALHHADYDFPEEVLETGMSMFRKIIGLLIS